MYQGTNRDRLSRVNAPVHVLLYSGIGATFAPEQVTRSLTDLSRAGHLPAAGDMARVSVSGATTTRFRPCVFAAYIAVSARLISCSTASRARYAATPTDAVTAKSGAFGSIIISCVCR